MVPHYIFCFEIVPFRHWEILLELLFASGFGKWGHAYSIHKDKVCNVLNSLGKSWEFFRQPLDISQESACSPSSIWSGDTGDIQHCWWNKGLKGPGGWISPDLAPPHPPPPRGPACKSFPPALWPSSLSHRFLLNSGKTHSISSAKLHPVLCKKP